MNYDKLLVRAKILSYYTYCNFGSTFVRKYNVQLVLSKVLSYFRTFVLSYFRTKVLSYPYFRTYFRTKVLSYESTTIVVSVSCRCTLYTYNVLPLPLISAKKYPCHSWTIRINLRSQLARLFFCSLKSYDLKLYKIYLNNRSQFEFAPWYFITEAKHFLTIYEEMSSYFFTTSTSRVTCRPLWASAEEICRTPKCLRKCQHTRNMKTWWRLPF